MKQLVTFIFLALLTLACTDTDDFTLTCGTEATVRDLRGLGGCGFVFELSDGTRLEPIIVFECGTPPVSTNSAPDPILNFQFVEGKRVRIGYVENNDYGSICMAGKPVKITCLEEISSPKE